MTDTGRRVRFLSNFDYKPLPSVTIAYQKGMIEYVRLECAREAVRLGKAELVTTPIPAGIRSKIAKKLNDKSQSSARSVKRSVSLPEAK